MSMPVRSKKQFDLAQQNTPALVGPGRYNVPERTTVPSYAAFASTNARVLNPNSSTSALTPGPGTYVVDAATANPARRAKQPSNAFRSKVARIGPIAKGSTPFQEATSSATPGPGSYDTRALQGSASAPALLPRSLPVVPAVRKPPAIPARSQSYGYEPGPGGKLVGQAPPSDIYSGLRNDTVGPAFYNPTVKRAVKLADFSKRSRDREVFRPTDNPGPGHYNPGTPGELAEGSTQQPRRGPLAKGRLQRSTQTAPSSVVRRKPQQSAVFKSKTPMAHEMKVKSNGEPGPGSYTPSVNGRRVSHSAQGFGSTSDRVGWARNPDMPYSDPDCVATPGPGTYGGRSSAAEHAKRAATAAMLEDGPSIAFASSDGRYCMRSLPKSSQPGPGSYTSGGQLNLLASTLSQRTRGRPGNFGANEGRFRGTFSSETNLSVRETPGPGHYDVAAGSRVRRRQRGSPAFRSESERFQGWESNTIHIVGRSKRPPPTKYNVHRAWAKQAKQPAKGPVPFASTSRRFDSGLLGATPGPGTYDASVVYDGTVNGDSRVGTAGSTAGLSGLVGTRGPAGRGLGGGFGKRGGGGHRYTRGFNTTTMRFQAGAGSYMKKSTSSATLGPGSYNISGQFVTRSHNITMV